MRRLLIFSALALGALAFFAGGTTPSSAANFVVSDFGDSGPNTLRDAITQAEATAAADTITFTGGGTINLVTQLPSITRPLTIIGPGSGLLFINGCSGTCNVLAIDAGTFNGSGFTMQNGSSGFANGSAANTTLTDVTISGHKLAGAVYFFGTHTINNSKIISNASLGVGGGIQHLSGGNVTINNSLIANNTAGGSGGGISLRLFTGSMTLNNTTVRGNSATRNGGGIYLDPEFPDNRLTVNSSTISGNSAPLGGGGIFAGAGLTTLVNTTVSNNTASGGVGGGGVAIPAGSGFTSTNSTIADNTAAAGRGGGVWYGPAATGVISNTLIAHNLAGGNCSGPFASGGGNLSDDATCSASLNQSTDQNGAAANLIALADNGGTTLTHLPGAGSLAIDRGNNTGCPATDQRGQPRPRDGDGNGSVICDIGAVETAGATAPPTTVLPPTISKTFSPSTTTVGGTTTMTIIVRNPNTATSLANVSFSDTFPGGMFVSGTIGSTGELGVCGTAGTAGGGTLTGGSLNSTSLSLSGATMAANGGCAIVVALTTPQAGSFTNMTTIPTATGTTGGVAAQAPITVLAGESTTPPTSPAAPTSPVAPAPPAPPVLPPPSPPFVPQVFQNPAAVAIVGGIGSGTRNNTPVPARPAAVAPSTGAPAAMPAITPPSTGDAGLVAPLTALSEGTGLR